MAGPQKNDKLNKDQDHPSTQQPKTNDITLVSDDDKRIQAHKWKDR